MSDPTDTGSASGASSATGTGGYEGTAAYHVDADDLIAPVERATHPDPDVAREHKSWLPTGKLPGFGTAREQCGEQIPEARHYCMGCGIVKPFEHVCYRNACPDHAPHAIRRRAAGSADAAGIAPKLDALRRYLTYHRDDGETKFHHLTFSPPDGWLVESDEPLERGFQVIRELMDTLGIQGVAIYHPFRQEKEDHEADDLGDWGPLLFDGLDWGDVREQLSYEPHFHVVGAAPWVDFSDVGAFHDQTGWVAHRISHDTEHGDGISIWNDEQMVRAVTYCLSHCMTYRTDGGQVRLAARMKGPDVHRVTPTAEHKIRLKSMVRDEAESTLGIAGPDFECDEPEPEAVDVDDVADRLGYGGDDAEHGFGRAGSIHVGGSPGPADPFAPGSSASVGGIGTSSSTLGGGSSSSGGGGGGGGGGGSSSGGGSRSSAGGGGGGRDEQGSDDVAECGGRIRHISQAGEQLLDGQWRRAAPYADVLDDAYREYVDHVTVGPGGDPVDARPEIPAFRDDDDRPPPD